MVLEQLSKNEHNKYIWTGHYKNLRYNDEKEEQEVYNLYSLQVA